MLRINLQVKTTTKRWTTLIQPPNFGCINEATNKSIMQPNCYDRVAIGQSKDQIIT